MASRDSTGGATTGLNGVLPLSVGLVDGTCAPAPKNDDGISVEVDCVERDWDMKFSEGAKNDGFGMGSDDWIGGVGNGS